MTHSFGVVRCWRSAHGEPVSAVVWWRRLPEPLKVCLVAMVRAAGGTD